MGKVEYLYPTPVYSTNILDYQTLNYYIDKVIEKVDFHYKDNWGATHYLSTDFVDHLNIIEELGLHKIKKEIDNHLRKYCEGLNYETPDYKLESWFSKFKKGNYAQIHHHKLADIAGVYYYKTTGEDGDIFFESPNPFLEITKCYSTKFGQRVCCRPKEGTMLLFPGWMKHGVMTNLTDDTRISLSFNISFKEHGQG